MSAVCESTIGRVREFIFRHSLLASTDRVFVGFSGGADSTALLIILQSLHPDVVAVHMHHGIRGDDADRDAAWCRDFCQERGLPLQIQRLMVPLHRQRGEGIEAAARRLRLDAWSTIARLGERVALGHHADDCIEDLFLRLVRGANVSGLTSLRPLRTIGNVCLIRPLLRLHREEIHAFLRAAGIAEWCIDSSNADIDLRRNAVRHQWLPLIHKTLGGDQGIRAGLDVLREDADFIEQAATAAAAELPPDELPAALLNALHPALLPRVLRLWLQRETGNDVILTRAAIHRLRSELSRPTKNRRRIPLSGSLTVILTAAQRLRIVPRRQAIQRRTWKWREQSALELPEIGAVMTARLLAPAAARPAGAPEAEYFEPSALPEVLIVRRRAAGDSMVPFARRTSKKIKDILNDAGIAAEVKDSVPLVEASGTIIWAAAVKRAEFGRLPPGDTEAVELRLSPKYPVADPSA